MTEVQRGGVVATESVTAHLLLQAQAMSNAAELGEEARSASATALISVAHKIECACDDSSVEHLTGWYDQTWSRVLAEASEQSPAPVEIAEPTEATEPGE